MAQTIARRPPGPQGDTDSVAWTAATRPEPGIRLEFISQNGVYKSPELFDRDGRRLSTAGFEVPIAGFSVSGQMYIFHTTDRICEARGAGGLDVFWLGPDAGIRSTWSNPIVDGGTWRPLAEVSQPHAARVPPAIAAVSRLDRLADVFWIDEAGGIGTAFANPSVAKGTWQTFSLPRAEITARADASLAAVARSLGGVDLFWSGTDDAVWTTFFNPQFAQGQWQIPFRIHGTAAIRAPSPIVAVNRLDELLDVFWFEADGGIGSAFANPAIDGGHWQKFSLPRGEFTARADSPLAAVKRSHGGVDLFWIGSDDCVWTTFFNPQVDRGRWQAPFAIRSAGRVRARSPIAAVNRQDDLLDLFWFEADGGIGSAFSNPVIARGDWQKFSLPRGAPAHPDSPLAAVVRAHHGVDLFFIDWDSAVSSTYFNPQFLRGQWQAPFRITGPTAANLPSGLAAISRHNGLPPKTLMRRTVLAIARNNDPTDLHALFDFSKLTEGGKFLNVACATAPNGAAGAPFEGPLLLAWGSARYRESNVYLACAPLAPPTCNRRGACILD